MYGWAGKILRVDLSKKEIYKEPLREDIAINFLGGRGLNAKILYDELEVGIDPLGPKNILIFGVGPANGAVSAIGAMRHTVSALSPMSGGLGDANAAGYWGAKIKFAGYDAVVIKGKAKKPVYIWIDDETVEIKDASHLWGKTTWETDDLIKKEVGDTDISVAYIGQGGENLVRFACVMNDKARAAGRCGMGAVMGSKKLKAIAVRGTGKVKVAKPKMLKKIVKQHIRAHRMDKKFYDTFGSKQGSMSLMEHYNMVGIIPTKNYQTGTFDKIDQLSGETFAKKYCVRQMACGWGGCILRCSHWYRVMEGPYAGIEGEGPEFESAAGFGSKCLNSDMATVIMANELCNKYSLDTISTSSVISFALECFEKKLISQEETGLKLQWGDGPLIIDLIHKIAKREGFGDFLAEGVKRMADKIGAESKGFAPVVKGVEIPNADARVDSWPLGFAVSSRGGDHLHSFPIGSRIFPPEVAEKMFGTKDAVDAQGKRGKGRLVAWHEHSMAVINSMEICVRVATGQFKPITEIPDIVNVGLLFPKAQSKLINAITGKQLSEKDVSRIGERIVNLERAFNVRRGFSRKDDTIPERFLKEPLPEGMFKGYVLNLEPLLDEYYEIRGWNVETGIPKREKLLELGLTDVADDLEREDFTL